jgi:hypothetical protein
MSFLKKIKFKEKISLLQDFFHDFIFIKRSIYALGISIVFSLYIIQTSVPQFEISSTLREAGLVKNQSVSGGANAQALFIGSQISEFNSSAEFSANMHSYVLAQRMWQQGWGSKVFGNGDLNEEYFNTIPKNHKISDKIAAFLLGYDLFEFYSAHDLQAIIKDNFSPQQDRVTKNISVSALNPNKEFTIEFMTAVILETDDYAKESLIQKSNEVIASTYKQLATSRNSSISSALGSTINAEYYKIANLDNDMPYGIYIIDPPHSSEYPVSPNISSIILSNLITFLFLSILFSFVQKNKEDLW